jgi:hypothetical protein
MYTGSWVLKCRQPDRQHPFVDAIWLWSTGTLRVMVLMYAARRLRVTGAIGLN